MRIQSKRAIAAAAAVVIALTSFEIAPAMAASPQSKRPEAATHIDGLEVSARRRHRRHRGDAAMLGAVATVFGTIATLAARDRYRKRYYGYYGPHPYYGYYGYYGPPHPYRRGW
jgi:hypothetical protein